jgi:hypothetical protein
LATWACAAQGFGDDANSFRPLKRWPIRRHRV